MDKIQTQIDATIAKMERQIALYEKIAKAGEAAPFLEEAIALFGPSLLQKNAKAPLHTIYDAFFHQKSGSLIVANRGVTLFCLSPQTKIPFLLRHIALSVYKPDLGLEAVNVGLVGNVYEGDVVLRAESACPPSFLFDSQRCNCAYQWASVKELAAKFNRVNPPEHLSGEDFEGWTQKQFLYEGGRHLTKHSGRGVILMHLDSQAGMGSGFTEGEFVYDMYSRSLLRHLGENTSEQTYHLTIKEGYESIGVAPDARREGNQSGYQIPAIVLDYLEVSKSLIVLSNNRYKLGQLQDHGYTVQRVQSYGKIDLAGAREAKQRGEDFAHMNMDGAPITFEEELRRLESILLMSYKG